MSPTCQGTTLKDIGSKFVGSKEVRNPGADTEKLKGGGTGYCNQGSVRKHTKARGVWGHAPQENFGKYDL